MKSEKLKRLQRCNNNLRSNSWLIYQEFLRVLCSSLDLDEARHVTSLLDSGDIRALIEFADCLSSTEYATATKHRLCNQLAAVIRKYPFTKDQVDLDPRARALETFRLAERKCTLVNRRFRLFDTLRSPHEEVLRCTSSWIRYVLGDFPSLPHIYELSNYGNGASIGVHGDATNSARKLLANRWTVSPGAFHYAYSALGQDVHIQELLTQHENGPYFNASPEALFESLRDRCDMVNHNNIAFVPKTAKTHRTIAVEPLLNGYIQKGIDSLMRKHLKRVGIDLEDQTLNKGLAKFGSLEFDQPDPYVTIDLSSASDSISIELCRRLLPPDWFYLLDSVRSKEYSLDGVKRRYEKFTSMGNGFCFPLETLIFASLCHYVYASEKRADDFTVYGDDIIVRKSVADRLLSLLKVFGFSVNHKKSCLSGPFRESCGADWFQGKDVRPITLDYCFDSVQSIFKFCNLSSSKDAWECIFSECRNYLTGLIPHEFLFVRPVKGNVDTALEVPMDKFMASSFSRWHRKVYSWSWLELRTSAVSDKLIRRAQGYPIALIRGALSGIQSSDHFTLRRKTSTKIVRVNPSLGWSLWLPGALFARCHSYDFWREFDTSNWRSSAPDFRG